MDNKIEKVVNDFKSSIDSQKDYSLKDLVKLLEDTYKNVHGKGKKKQAGGEKKPPSAYNIFIREEIARIQTENLVGVAANDFMKIAAKRWKAQKDGVIDSTSKAPEVE